ncbi:alpha/beta hydrolase [Actinomadura sp. CNU-125]|uniref:alpha/beta fold hydrolase n=1 Tax=Actinomadura sp. CNU-125 TaxID=1904961 RepID=UPI0029170728|nr:alpha/beta hydrolase [Actinomadura sp. CNU-125]
MTEIAHRFVEGNGGLRMHVAEAGEGPLVLLLHGFPECWYSWRRQLTALAAAGFHAVAPDQRGYARTGGPADPAQYTILHTAGDAVGLIDALGAERAVVVGHDWGAPVAWAVAQMRPDKVRGVVGMSVPHRPRGSRPPIEKMRRHFGDGYYMVRFQEPDAPEAELARDPASTFRRLLAADTGDGTALITPETGGVLAGSPEPGELPGWLTEDDIAAYVAEYADSGFAGPVNWYRNLDRNWELTTAWHRAPITPPALFIARPRPGGRPRRHRPPPRLRPRPPRHRHADRKRPLDPAGAPRRSERSPPDLPPLPLTPPPVGAPTHPPRPEPSPSLYTPAESSIPAHPGTPVRGRAPCGRAAGPARP